MAEQDFSRPRLRLRPDGTAAATVSPAPGSAPLREDESATGHRRTFHLLDAIRGIAALIVVQRHASWLFGGEGWPGTYLAVDLFFVLSGFVIEHSYGRKLRAGGSWPRFMLARLIRLYPLYLVGWIIGAIVLVRAVVDPSTRGLAATGLLSALLMLPNWGLPAVIGPRWSLTYELVANGVYAALARVLTTPVLLAIMVVSAAALALLVARGEPIDTGWQYYQAPMALARVGYSFFAGVLLHRI